MKKTVRRSLSPVANLKQAHWHSTFHKDYYGDGRSGLSGKASAAHRRAALEAVVPIANGSTILDMGCAEGLMLPPFLESGASAIHGVDHSAKRIASARELVRSNRVRFDTVELNDPACLDDEEIFESFYDIVLCLGVYQHLDEEIRRLVLYKALQRTGRYFVFRAPKAAACEAFPLIQRAGFQLDSIVKSPGVKKLYIYRRCRTDNVQPIPEEWLLGPAEELSLPPVGPEVFVAGPEPGEDEVPGIGLYGWQRVGAGAAVATIALVAGLTVVRIGIPDQNGAFLARQAQAAEHWDMHVVDSAANGADSLDVADLDSDGDQDLVAGWQQSGLVRLYENLSGSDGEQAWKKIDIAEGLIYMGLEDVSFADFDRDGRKESILTAVGIPGMQVTLHFLEQGQNPFEAESWTSERLTGFFSGDYNTVLNVPGRQSGASMIFAGHEAGVWAAEISWPPTISVREEGHWSQPVPGGSVRDIKLHDMNSDGEGDLLLTQQGHFGWLENPDEASGGVWAFRGMDRRVSIFAPCDIDGDGTSGVFAVNEADKRFSGAPGQYYEQENGGAESRGSISPPLDGTAPILPVAPELLICGDLNGHGFGEIVAGSPQALSLTEYDTSASQHWSRTAITAELADGNYKELRSVDMDADGDKDVLAAEAGASLVQRGLGVVWFENPALS